MREESSQWKEYKLLREEASKNYPFIFSLAIKQQIVSDTRLSFVIYLWFIWITFCSKKNTTILMNDDSVNSEISRS